MAKKIAFSLNLEKSDKLLKQLTSVELELSKVSKALNTAKKDIELLSSSEKDLSKAQIKRLETLKNQGKTIESITNDYKVLKDSQLVLREESKRLNTTLRQNAKNFDRLKENIPDDSLIGLRRRYEQLRQEIDLLSSSARQLPKNIKKIQEAESIKQQIDDIGASVRDFRSNVGNYQESINSLISFFKGNGGGPNLASLLNPPINPPSGGGSGLGSAISNITSSLGPYGVAVTAGVTATTTLIRYIRDTTLEFEKLNKKVGDTTGLVGEDLQKAVVGVKTLSTIFNQDFNEVLQATNTLTKEVTGDFNKSLDLIKIGLLSGANANNQFLDSIREYSTQIREAGASGQQFIQILALAQREGIYSDKGVDLVKEFGNRIREQTKATKTSLEEAFGKDFTDELFTNLNNGSDNTISALVKVSKKLNDTQLTAKQSQQVIADVFGGPGEDAGLRFIKILQNVDGNLESLIDTSDAYTQRQLALYDATIELNTQQEILAAQFAGTGTSMEALGIKAKALGTTLINEIVLTGRSIVETFKEGNILEGIASVINPAVASLTLLQDEKEKLKKSDSESLREIKEKEKDLATTRRKNAESGKLSIQDLRREQSLLKKEIDDARLSGEDYSDKLKSLELVNKSISKATSILNGNIKRFKKTIDNVAQSGSIDDLRNKVSDLEKELNSLNPKNAESTIKKLNEAKLDLSDAESSIEELKKLSIDFDSLSSEEKLEIYELEIEKKKQLQIQFANDRILNEKQLANTLSEISIESEIELINTKLKFAEEGSVKQIELLNQLSDKTKELDNLQIKINLESFEDDIENYRLVQERILIDSIDNEKQLQSQIKLLNLNTTISILQERLKLEKLTANEILKIETELINKRKEKESQQNIIDFEKRNNEINIDEEERLSNLIPELNFDNVEEALNALREFEERKNLLKLEKELERLESEKLLRISEGENILAIENDIAEKILEIDKEKNKKLIEERKNRLKIEEDLQRANAEVTTDVISGVASIVQDTFNGNLKTAEDTQKAFLKLMLDTVEKVVLAQVASAAAQSYAQADSVSTFGISGTARAAILTALIKGAFTIAKSAILSSEEGNILGVTQGQQRNTDFKRGSIFTGKSHSNGGIKFLMKNLGGDYTLNEAEGGEPILTKKAFKKWPGLISAINEDGGGKSLYSDSSVWKKLLQSFKVNKYEQGTVLGSPTVIPQLLNPSSKKIVSKIDNDDLENLIGSIVENQVNQLKPIIDSISDKVLIGLQEDTRFKDRLNSAKENSQL